MARNRKAAPKETPSPETLELSEDEQWRLINQTGILQKTPLQGNLEDVEEDISLGDEIFNSVTLIIPFSFLLLMMEILIHYQYGKRPSLQALTDRMLPGIPILSIFIFYSTRYKRFRTMQFLFFVMSLLVGPRLIYLINDGSWLTNMRQCPPLATIWVYAILQLDLGPAVLSLIAVGGFVWWKKLQIIF